MEELGGDGGGSWMGAAAVVVLLLACMLADRLTLDDARGALARGLRSAQGRGDP